MKQLTFDEAKELIQKYPKDLRIKVMGILYDRNLIEQREYSINEMAKLTGISKVTLHSIFNNAINKLRNSISKELI